MIKKIILIAALISTVQLASCFKTFAQTEVGAPFIKNYTPSEYDAHPQNWSVIQDHNGIMYFGNNNGILEYDGIQWRKITIENQPLIHSICMNSNGTIFAGGEDEIGYLAPDSLGEMEFVSFKDQLKSDDLRFNDIIYLTAVKEKIYFGGSKNIFIYDKGKISTCKAKTIFQKPYNVRNRVFVNQSIIGLGEIINDKAVQIQNGNFFANKPVTAMMEYDSRSTLIGTADNGLFLLEEFSNFSNTIKPFRTDVDEYIIANTLDGGIRLSSGNFAIYTRFGGVVIIDKNGNLVQLINKTSGLENETVHDIFEDTNNNLWIALNKGIAKADLISPITSFSERDGIEGMALSTIRHKGIIYVGTDHGVFSLEEKRVLEKEDIIHYKFAKVNGLSGYCIDFLKAGNKLFAATQFGLCEINDNEIKHLFRLNGALKLHQCKKDPSRIYLGCSNGLYIYEYKDDKLNFLETVKNIDIKARNIVEDSDGNIWLGLNHNGVYKLDFSESDFSPKIDIFNTSNGLADITHPLVFINDNKILVSTSKGLYKYKESDDRSTLFSVDTTFQAGDDEFAWFDLLTIGPKGDLWGITKDEKVGFFRKDEKGTYRWNTKPFKPLQKASIFGLYTDHTANIEWFGGSEGLYRFDYNKRSDYKKDFHAIIREISIGKDSAIFRGAKSDITEPFIKQLDNIILSHDENSITIKYAASFYQDESSLEYSYMLEKFNKNWSNWSTEPKTKYTNIPAGKYTFMVKARNIYGNESSVASFYFEVLPPWYKTIWAYLFYLVSLGAIIYLLIYLNYKRLKAANLKLEKIIRERTAEINHKNIELDKLSIVAREIDNIVIIMDSEGNLEWINESLTRTYGYTLDDYIKEKGGNFLDISSNKNIKEIFNKCLEEKIPVIYQSATTIKSGEKIWSQTTLTPILDEKENVKKVIAVGTDISKIKEAESKIKAQSDELLQNNKELERKNILITDSIRYAKRIQESILPDIDNIKKAIPELFIYFNPRDIVSGDFYWFSEQDDKIFLALVDCTGHGVPGAFMSMIGYTMLNQIVNEKKIFTPSEILYNLNQGITSSMKKPDMTTGDGMEISMCCIDKRNKKIEIASTNQNVFVFNNSTLEIIPGDMFSIGGIFSQRVTPVFSNHVIEIGEETRIYLSSDGYYDQYGGENNKKFMISRFEKLLTENHTLSMQEQSIVLDKILNQWKGENKQIDDICVIGLKIS